MGTKRYKSKRSTRKRNKRRGGGFIEYNQAIYAYMMKDLQREEIKSKLENCNGKYVDMYLNMCHYLDKTILNGDNADPPDIKEMRLQFMNFIYENRDLYLTPVCVAEITRLAELV